MTITGQSSLPKDDIARMVKDAEAHADDDRRRREEAEARNQADTLVYQTEKLLREHGDKVPADERQSVESALADVKEKIAGTDTEALNRSLDALRTASQSLGQKMYEQAASEQAGGGGTSGGTSGASDEPSEDEVVDAEIVEGPESEADAAGA
jgi:molecular chaperone DnaK